MTVPSLAQIVAPINWPGNGAYAVQEMCQEVCRGVFPERFGAEVCFNETNNVELVNSTLTRCNVTNLREQAAAKRAARASAASMGAYAIVSMAALLAAVL